MLKLMKYEFLKQRTSKIVLAGLLLLIEVVFIIGVLMGRDNLWATSVLFLTLIAICTFVVVGLEAIFTYYHDLRDKTGYMVFMTPNSVFKIMGSKLLTSIISIIGVTVVFLLITFLDVTLIAARNDELVNMFNMLRMILREMYNIEIDWAGVIISAANVVFGWIGMVTSGFLAITLVMTVLESIRGKGIISFIGFCIINVAFEWISVKIDNVIALESYAAQVGLMTVLTIVFSGVCYFLSGYLLNRELSL